MDLQLLPRHLYTRECIGFLKKDSVPCVCNKCEVPLLVCMRCAQKVPSSAQRMLPPLQRLALHSVAHLDAPSPPKRPRGPGTPEDEASDAEDEASQETVADVLKSAADKLDSQELSQNTEEEGVVEEHTAMVVDAADKVEDMDLKDTDADRTLDKLTRLKNELVLLLRSVAGYAKGEQIPTHLIKQANTLRSKLWPFARVEPNAETVQQMLQHLDRILAAVAVVNHASSGRRMAAPVNELDGESAARFIGRASVRLKDGSEEQSFLLFRPRYETHRRRFQWLALSLILRENFFLEVFEKYEGPKGADEAGNGFVVQIVDRKNTGGERKYHVQWTISQELEHVHVPKGIEYEWLLQSELVNMELATKFDSAYEVRFQEEHDGDGGADRSGNIDGVGDAGDVANPYDGYEDSDSSDEPDDLSESSLQGTEGSDQTLRLHKQSALKWSPSQGRPLLSMRRVVALHGESRIDAMLEYTVSRIFALHCCAPPVEAPTVEEICQLGEDLYTMDAKELDKAFGRSTDGTGGETIDAWRSKKANQLANEASGRWAAIRASNKKSLETLEKHLTELKAVQASIDEQERNVPSVDAGCISRPKIRLPKIRERLSQPARSDLAVRWLRLLREVHSSAASSSATVEQMAPAYGNSWPPQPTAVTTPPDHVVPIRSLRMGAGLVIEHGDPAQNPANLVLCTLSQNSAKSDFALGLFSAPDELHGSPGQDIYSPPDVSEAKKAMLAKTVAMMFALYWGISNKKRSAGIGPYARGVGCGVYARAWDRGPFKDLVRKKATRLERRIALITAALPQWGTYNPLVFQPQLLGGDLEKLLLARFKGTDQLSELVDAALQESVSGAPR